MWKLSKPLRFTRSGNDQSLDVRDPFSINELIKDQNYLFNLAANEPLDSMENPFTDLHQCKGSTVHSRGLSKTILTSASFLQVPDKSTKPQYLPVDEKHALHPRMQRRNKIAGESYHILYNEDTAFPQAYFALRILMVLE